MSVKRNKAGKPVKDYRGKHWNKKLKRWVYT